MTDRASIIAPPPLLFFLCLGAGYLLDRLVPIRFLDSVWKLRLFISFIPLSIALLLSGWAFFVFHKHKTPFDPAKPTLAIICNGPFCFTRNPLYIALILVFLGLAIMLGSIWQLIMTLFLLLLLDIGVVREEEQYLFNKFGNDYQIYKKSVRRWI